VSRTLLGIDSSLSGVLDLASLAPGKNSELGRPPCTPRLPLPNEGRAPRLSLLFPGITPDEACRGWEVVEEAIPRLPKPLAAPEEAVGGPRDCRVSLAGCPGSVGVEGAGPGEGDRWGLRV
jgi:hypothetical protein